MYVMHVIEVREWGKGGVLVELRGEFDGHNLEDLRQILDSVLALRRPTMVDLSGVTFLDLGATRELTIRSRLYAHHLTFRNPSPRHARAWRRVGLKSGSTSALTRKIRPAAGPTYRRAVGEWPPRLTSRGFRVYGSWPTGSWGDPVGGV